MSGRPYRTLAGRDGEPASEGVTMNEAAEQERKKMALATTFDRLVESNLQLVRTVRTALVVVTACAVVSMSWSAFTTYSMRETLIDMRGMLQRVLEKVETSR